METLSVVVICHNEVSNIEACLESVTWADEIVVVDSGSTDRTVELSRGYTDRVYTRPWAGYPAQKNAAFDLAASDWILSLDADERVTPGLAEKIKAVLAASDPGLDGYFLRRKVFYGRKWLRYGGFHPERILRLFRRGRGRCSDRTVHETIEVTGKTGLLQGYLEHYTYKSVSDYLQRLERYSSLSAEEYHRQGRTTGPVRMSGHAIFSFLQMFIFRRGFLDGYEGFLLAVLYSFYTFAKYAKLKELAEGARA
ncbi:MAG: glycosyltransferase family 2 protein [Pseudomonadota bacterium]